MYEVIRKDVVLFRSVSLDRCKQFMARHGLTKVATIQPVKQMIAA